MLKKREIFRDCYCHFEFDRIAAEMARMEEVESARKEQQKLSGEGENKDKLSKKMFRVV